MQYERISADSFKKPNITLTWVSECGVLPSHRHWLKCWHKDPNSGSAVVDGLERILEAEPSSSGQRNELQFREDIFESKEDKLNRAEPRHVCGMVNCNATRLRSYISGLFGFESDWAEWGELHLQRMRKFSSGCGLKDTEGKEAARMCSVIAIAG